MYVVSPSAGNYKIIIKVIHGRTFFASGNWVIGLTARLLGEIYSFNMFWLFLSFLTIFRLGNVPVIKTSFANAFLTGRINELLVLCVAQPLEYINLLTQWNWQSKQFSWLPMFLSNDTTAKWDRKVQSKGWQTKLAVQRIKKFTNLIILSYLNLFVVF